MQVNSQVNPHNPFPFQGPKYTSNLGSLLDGEMNYNGGVVSHGSQLDGTNQQLLSDGDQQLNLDLQL